MEAEKGVASVWMEKEQLSEEAGRRAAAYAILSPPKPQMANEHRP